MNISLGKEHPFYAVQGVSFDLNADEKLAIVGESGSGKSMTALTVMGLQAKVATVSGEIIFNDPQGCFDLASLRNPSAWQQIRGRRISMIFQEPMSALNPLMTIGAQLSESIQVHQSLSTRDVRRCAEDWLDRVQLSDVRTLYRRYPHELSGGQKQRAMIAMALCNHPALLIADEPTTALDATIQGEIMELMRVLQQETRTAIIFITHDLALAAGFADRVLVMHEGIAVEYGSLHKVFSQPEALYTRALLACRPRPQYKGGRLPVIQDFMDSGNVHQEISPIPNPASVGRNSILKVENLSVTFRQKDSFFSRLSAQFIKAVDDVSFFIQDREVVGLVGESGCGKSTLSKALIGLIPVESGHVLFQDINVTQKVPSGMQMVFQNPFSALNPRMTASEMLLEPLRIHGIVKGNALHKEVLRLLDAVHLPSSARNRYPHEFSGGQRQRLNIARALASRPQLLICDEIVSALDVSVQAHILNLLRELKERLSLSYLFISHDLSVVYYLSDRVMVMQAGRIVEQGSAKQVLVQPKSAYTQNLIASMPDQEGFTTV